MTRVSWLWRSSVSAPVSQCSVARRRFVQALVSVLACGFFLFTSAAWAQTVTAYRSIGFGEPGYGLGCPIAVAVNPVTNKIYVPFWYGTDQNENVYSGGLGVIDGATNAVVFTARELWRPTAVAVNPVTNKIYVANITPQGSGTVVVVDGVTNGSITISAGTNPKALAVNTATNKVYVANGDSNNVTVIDGQTLSTATVSVGGSPVSLAVNPVTNKIYVPNSASNTVTVIDGATNSTTTVSAGSTPVAVAVNPVTNKIYVANYGNSSVTVIDGATNGTTTVSPAGTTPVAIAVNPVTDKIYVVNWVTPLNPGYVTVIDGATNVTSVLGDVGSQLAAIALNPATDELYVPRTAACNNSGWGTDICLLSVLDGTGGHRTALKVGTQPRSVAVNPVTNTIYVTGYWGSDDTTVTVIAGDTDDTTTVSLAGLGTSATSVAVNPVTDKIYFGDLGYTGIVPVIDGATNTTTMVRTGQRPSAVAVNPVTNKIYFADIGPEMASGDVTVFDEATNATVTVSAGTYPIALAVNPVSNKIYVANQGSDNVTVVDGATNATVTVSAGTAPIAIDVNPVTNRIYVANWGSNDVTVIDGATNATWTVSAGTHPIAIAVNPATNLIYVANSGSNDVTAIDGANYTTWTYSAGTNPIALAVNPASNKIYVANSGSNNVTIIDGANSATWTVGAGTGPAAVAVDPVANRIYVANFGSNNVTVLDGSTNTPWTVGTGTGPVAVGVDPVTNKIYVATQGSLVEPPEVTVISPNTKTSIPLTAVLAGTTDEQTIAGNAIYSTSNSSPSFTAIVTSSYTPNPPPPTAFYYQLDMAQGAWQQAIATSGRGSNPASYSFTASNVPLGLHTVYAYAVYGDEGTSVSNRVETTQGVGNSPMIGKLSAFTFVVLPVPTTTQLTADVNPQNAGSQVALTAHVEATYGDGIFHGTVTFLDGGALLAEVALDGTGHASFQTSSLVAGTHSITAAYGGAGSYGASTSNALSEIIAGAPASIAAVSGGEQSAPINTAFADPLVVSVTDSNNNPVPNVQVTFSGAGLSFSGGGTVATGSNGQASVTATPTALGTLLGLANVTGLSPATFSLTTTIQVKSPVVVTLTASTASTFVQNSVTFTAAVNSASDIPTGTVTFMDGSTALGSATMDSSGTATLTVSTLTSGSHSITAVYSGDANCAGNTSPAMSETVQDFQLAVTGSSSASVAAGETASYTLHLSLANGATVPSAVTFSLTGLPPGANYTIAPSTIAAGSGAQNVIVVVETAATARLGRLFDRYGASFTLALLPMLLGLVRLRSSKRRRAMRAFSGLLVLIAALGMWACGGGSFNNKPAQTYTLQLSATSGSLVHSTALTLTIR